MDGDSYEKIPFGGFDLKVCVFNLGCKVNRYEADRLISLLKARGCETSEELCEADAYIINTCAVTNEAEKKSRQAVARALKLNPSAKILICGCASQHNPEQFSSISGVTFVKGVADKDAIVDHLFDKGTEVDALPLEYNEGGLISEGRTRAVIKIADGCNNFCSYCLIPFLRGRVRSRSSEEIRKEFDILRKTHDEIVLTGIDISSYGKDIGSSLGRLVTLLSDGKTRLRLGSLEVNVITREFLDSVSQNSVFCDHFHLSLQSGSREVLKRMNRHYTPEAYLEAVDLIRSYYPEAAVTTDIIAGFPTETDEMHEETLAFAKEVAFANIHVFEYSLRNGTNAAKMEQVPSEIKGKRVDDLIALKKELRNAYLSKFEGAERSVIFEDDGGYTSNYIRVYSDVPVPEGKLIPVVLTERYKDGFKCVSIENKP